LQQYFLSTGALSDTWTVSSTQNDRFCPTVTTGRRARLAELVPGERV
jgi:hypothetical protein